MRLFITFWRGKFWLALAAMVAVAAAQPVSTVSTLIASGHGMEPAWMVLSGATLLAIASAVRRYVP